MIESERTRGEKTYRERASSAEYLRITSPFSSWYSRSETRMMSPLLIQIFFLSLPRMRPRRLTPSKHCRKSQFCCFYNPAGRAGWPDSDPSQGRDGGNGKARCVGELVFVVAYHGLESAVAQHLQDLGVFLPVLLECEFALLIAAMRLRCQWAA